MGIGLDHVAAASSVVSLHSSLLTRSRSEAWKAMQTRTASIAASLVVLVGQLTGCVDGPTRAARTAARVNAEAATAAARDAYAPLGALARAARFNDRSVVDLIVADARAEAPYVEHTVSVSGVQYALYSANAAAAFSAAAAAFNAYADAGASDRATAAARAARVTARGLSQLTEAEVAVYSSHEDRRGRSPFDFNRPPQPHGEAPDPLLAFRAAVDAFDVDDGAETFFTNAAATTEQ